MKNFLLLLLIHLFNVSLQAQTSTYNCYFEFNSAKYHTDSLPKLIEWINQYKSYKHVKFELYGYTDTIGSISYNDQLAKSRLASVAGSITDTVIQITKQVPKGEQYSLKNYAENKEYRKVEIIATFDQAENPEKQSKRKDKDQSDLSTEKEHYLEERFEEFDKKGNDVTINLKIQFENNSDVYYDWDSATQVYILSEYLKKYPNKKVEIQGHVCCSNSYDISLLRAKKVHDDLIRLKISPNRIKYEGFSNRVPLVKEVDEFSQQQNRRVEVIFYE